MEMLLGLGSNLGDRTVNLRNAIQALKQLPKVRVKKISPVLETEAMIPESYTLSADSSVTEDWHQPFLNLVVSCQIDCDPHQLLIMVKGIEKKMGRAPAARWAPRIVDIDLLDCEGQILQSSDLTLPHPGFSERAFVQVPLSHLQPSYPVISRGHPTTCLANIRELHQTGPLWMGIMNLTPDSFSDGQELAEIAKFQNRVRLFREAGVQILDLGGYSTRPGAKNISLEEEWARLAPALGHLRDARGKDDLFPLISVDTFRAEVARRAIALGANIVNDVSGLNFAEMVPFLQSNDCQYVLMHSLSVPADPKVTVDQKLDIIPELINWAEEKLNLLVQKNISLDRIMFDPGIGFGKTATQSWRIINRFSEFKKLPVRTLVGHSRKSYLQRLTRLPFPERDLESAGTSLRLAEMGADILRVHNPLLHMRVHRAYRSIPTDSSKDPS